MRTVRTTAAAVGVAGMLVAASAGCASAAKPATAAAPSGSSTSSPSPTSTTATTTLPATPSTVTKTVSSSGTQPNFGGDYASESSGVVLISESTCNGDFDGSGFLVAPNLVVTAAHVVAGETTLSVKDPVGGTSVAGQVVGLDTAHDVALVRTQSPLTGHLFTFATADPQIGSPIAAIGYPLGGPESITDGLVSGLGRTITVGSQTLTGMIQTNVPINPGNSGGPMIAMDGTVVGIADAGNPNAQGINFAISTTQATPLVTTWRQSPAVVPATTCQGSQSQSQQPAPTTTTPSTSVDDAVATLMQYIDDVNAGDFTDAYALLTASGQQAAGSESQWAQGLAGSVYTNPQVANTSTLPNGGYDIELTFTSTQPGQSCKQWDLDYHLLPGPNGSYLIDIALPHNGGSGSTPC